MPAKPTILSALPGTGLGSVSVLLGTLTIYVDNSLGPVPGPLAPSFLPNLQEVGSLIIKECANCSVNPDIAPAGTNRSLTGLPGLTNLYRIATPSNPTASATLVIQNTGFANLTSFVGLRCSPSFVLLQGNPALSSLQGLQNLVPAVPPGPAYFLGRAPLLKLANAKQLTSLAGCPPPKRSSNLTTGSTLYIQNCLVKVCALLLTGSY
jgi:hypothetical protein